MAPLGNIIAVNDEGWPECFCMLNYRAIFYTL
jgi:hypothetical protein